MLQYTHTGYSFIVYLCIYCCVCVPFSIHTTVAMYNTHAVLITSLLYPLVDAIKRRIPYLLLPAPRFMYPEETKKKRGAVLSISMLMFCAVPRFLLAAAHKLVQFWLE